MLGQHLKKFAESHGVGKATEYFSQGCAEGKIRPDQVHLRELAESMLGKNWATVLQRKSAGLREAVEAVDGSGFVQITGQLLIDQIKAKYNAAEFIGDKLCVNQPITNGNLGPQRTPWLSDVLDDSSQIQPGMEVPSTGFVPNYIDAPEPAKYGKICSLTFEMIFADRTTQARDSAGSVGRRVRINKEERIFKVVYGIVNNHSWNGTNFNTFQTAAPWVNTISGNSVQSWSDLNNMEMLFTKMLDPNTGKPIDIQAKTVLVMPYKYYQWRQIQTATNVRTGAYATTGLNPQTDAPSPLTTDYEILQSKYAYQQVLASSGGLTDAQTREYVVMGDFMKAFGYREVFPMQAVEAPPMNEAEFNQHIVLRVRALEFGVCYVMDPRYVLLSYNT